jgi:hypothetical protein
MISSLCQWIVQRGDAEMKDDVMKMRHSTYLSLLVKLGSALFTLFLLRLALLENGFGNEDIVLGRHAPVITKYMSE